MFISIQQIPLGERLRNDQSTQIAKLTLKAFSKGLVGEFAHQRFDEMPGVTDVLSYQVEHPMLLAVGIHKYRAPVREFVSGGKHRMA
jgi:hypothetical protein